MTITLVLTPFEVKKLLEAYYKMLGTGLTSSAISDPLYQKLLVAHKICDFSRFKNVVISDEGDTLTRVKLES